ncbi:MAG TPA: phytanoyl-CoA dioxygenase family protein [Paenibacillus sp.]|uniref:phytanoyl-CoA dioxygenase family protein n=1 Tax=Paenibacillus sp. TaxID=58172 RepID=UPI002C9BE365|nr:phytanoyl-CoA dioxygenase family protein [Paenibacillus sp.]HUC90415.1 phytanoyl-CoA dioxygenase family protein [Paenibacillus sp.]
MFMKLSDKERETGVLEAENVRIAAEQVRKNGYIVLEQVLGEEQINELRAAFDPLFAEFTSRKGFNTGTNRAQMFLPFSEPFCSEHVIAHPMALSIIDQLIGSDCRCVYFASDTAGPGSDYQNVHSDLPPLFPELGVALPVYSLVLNIPLVDVTEENGPLEIWPGGTHLDPDSTRYTDIWGDKVRAAKYMHSEKVVMKAGSMVIRDIRMWHRGTPNVTDTMRTNLAFIYNREWYGAGGGTPIPQATYDRLSERARMLLRTEKVGAAVKMPWEY